MPIYEYACTSCKKTIDVMQKVSDPPPGQCDHCGAEQSLQKIVSRTSFVLKGGGWYSDLYSSTKPSQKNESNAADSKSSSSSSSTASSAP